MKKTIKAPAKINLCLKVNGKREDSYHDLSMVMQEISLFDTIDFEIVHKNTDKVKGILPTFDLDFLNEFSKKFDYKGSSQINIRCNYSYLPTDDRNLLYKVTKYIYDKYSISDRIYIYLKKMIPTSGGLGGGSSDAASMLLFLNKYYNLKLSIDDLVSIASIFGSDIPFFIHKRVSLCEGRGEIIKEIKPFNNYFILIATPNTRISTTEIYNRYDDVIIDNHNSNEKEIKINRVIEAINSKDLKKLTSNLFNDLEVVTENLCEKVSLFKKRILDLGGLVSLMSGSGPTVFGIFNSYFKVNNCKNIMKKENPDSFIYVARPI